LGSDRAGIKLYQGEINGDSTASRSSSYNGGLPSFSPLLTGAQPQQQHRQVKEV